MFSTAHSLTWPPSVFYVKQLQTRNVSLNTNTNTYQVSSLTQRSCAGHNYRQILENVIWSEEFTPVWPSVTCLMVIFSSDLVEMDRHKLTLDLPKVIIAPPPDSHWSVSISDYLWRPTPTYHLYCIAQYSNTIVLYPQRHSLRKMRESHVVGLMAQLSCGEERYI